MSPPALAERVLAADPRAVARAISLIEDEHGSAPELIRAIFHRTGRAYLIGVTGPPGAGKSTLVDQMIRECRRAGRTVGVIAIDPTSPFTGGAVLGDRVRMQAHAGDDGVFIRSMATRGNLGGLSRATSDAALVLDAAGRDVIVIETVGVGQAEVDIVRTADISIVVLVPGTGDEVQALKAGIMEIADIFVVNKADREGADRLVSAIEANLSLHTFAAEDWRPPILKTSATTGAGVNELAAAIQAFRTHADARAAAGGVSLAAARRRSRDEFRLRELVARRFMERVEHQALTPGDLAAILDRIGARDVDPYTAASGIVARALGSAPEPLNTTTS